MKSPDAPLKKILIIRNDKLGDFILSLPVFALIKSALPGCRVYALVPEYTRDIAACCPWIDDIIVDPGEKSGIRGTQQLAGVIKQQRFDAVITLFSTTRIALAVFLAGIPRRFAPATKVAQIFYNHRLTQRRSKSEKPEFAYNLDLAKYCLKFFKIDTATEPEPPFLFFDTEEISTLKAAFCNTHQINPHSQIIFLHPGSGGSANNLSPEQYAKLADELHSKSGHTVVITAGPGELSKAQTVSRLINTAHYVVYESTQGLPQFAKHIQFANVFISGSTGPLHIAGALDIPTAAFYTRLRSATSLRWQTLNSPEKRLAFSPPETTDECDMNSIDISKAAKVISETFLSE